MMLTQLHEPNCCNHDIPATGNTVKIRGQTIGKVKGQTKGKVSKQGGDAAVTAGNPFQLPECCCATKHVALKARNVEV